MRNSIAYGCMLIIFSGCTDAITEITGLDSSSLSLTFSGKTSATKVIFSNTDSVTLSGECNSFISNLEWAFDGSTWQSVTSLADASSDTDCSDGSFSLLINDLSTAMTISSGETKTVNLRGSTILGNSPESTFYVKHKTVPDPGYSSMTDDGNIVASNVDSIFSTITITIKDSSDLPISEVVPTISISGSNNHQIGACTSSDASGISTCKFRSTTAEVKNISVMTPTVLASETTNVTVDPDVPYSIVFSTEPGNQQMSGAVFPTQPTVYIYDQFSNITNFSSTVSIDTVPSGNIAAGSTSTTASSGVASFTGLTIDAAGTYYLRATASTATGDSSSFTVGPDRLQILGGLSSFEQFSCEAFSIYTRDTLNTNAPVITNTTIQLTTTAPSASFYSDASCSTSLPSDQITISSGQSNIIAYIQSSASGGPYNISASVATGLALTTGTRTDLTFSSAPVVQHVTSSVTNTTYGIGSLIPINVVFDQNVDVTGTPQLTIVSDSGGSGTTVLNYSSGSGTSELTFNYTVSGGDNSTDLDYQSVSSLALNGGSITFSGSSTPAQITLPTPASANSLSGMKTLVIDGFQPTITAITPPADDIYVESDFLDFDIVFDKNVVVTSTPRISLNVGGSTVYANYYTGDGTSTLTFRYDPSFGDNDYDGISIASSVSLNGGTIQDAFNNDAVLSYSAPSLTNVWVNTKSFCAPYQANNVSALNAVGGDGTSAGTAYLICTHQQLNNLGSLCGPVSTECNSYFELMGDIDLSSYTGTSFNIIGNSTNPFQGTFRGNDYTISNFSYSDNSRDFVGLFGVSSAGSIIDDIRLHNINIVGQDHVGGIVGRVSGTGQVINIEVSGTLSGSTRVGGVIGSAFNPSITDSKSHVNVTGLERVGGFIGEAAGSSTILSRNSSYGPVNETLNGYAGGFVGYMNGNAVIEQSFSVGDVSSVGDNIGGFAGNISSNNIVRNCYAKGDINGSSDNVGGFFGIALNSISSIIIEKNYSIGIPTGSGSDINGFGGQILSSISGITSNVWDTDTSGNFTPNSGVSGGNGNIEGMSTSSMQFSSPYSGKGWDFSTIWEILSGPAYPTLQNNNEYPEFFTTLDSSFNTDNTTYGANNLSFQNTNGTNGHEAVRALVSKNTGKWYFEVEVINAPASGTNLFIGWGSSATSPDKAIGTETGASLSGGCDALTGVCKKGNTLANGNIPQFNSVGTVVGVALDLDTGDIWMRINGEWSKGPPGTGIPTFTSISGSVYPMVSSFAANTQVKFNFGPTFKYSKPTGYKAIAP